MGRDPESTDEQKVVTVTAGYTFNFCAEFLPKMPPVNDDIFYSSCYDLGWIHICEFSSSLVTKIWELKGTGPGKHRVYLNIIKLLSNCLLALPYFKSVGGCDDTVETHFCRFEI